MENDNKYKKVIIIKKILLIILVVSLIWFGFTTYEYYSVKNDKRPLICLNKKELNENNNEKSMMCYGVFYKYKEYYFKKSGSITGREFALFFMAMDRNEDW